jgi:hypothetical protein
MNEEMQVQAQALALVLETDRILSLLAQGVEQACHDLVTSVEEFLAEEASS